MQHYHVEKATLGDILTEFFHDPEDQRLSVEELLEDRLESGYALVSIVDYAGSGTWYLTFRVVAK